MMLQFNHPFKREKQMKKWFKNLFSTSAIVISGSVVMGDVVVGNSNVSAGSFNSNDLKNLGSVISQTRDVTAFNKIDTSGVIDVQFIQGEKLSLVVEAQEGVLNKIKTNVENGTLVITTENNFFSNQKSVIKVTSPFPLVQVKHKGVSDFKASGIDTANFELDFSGTGDVSLEGQAESASFTTKGVGDVNAKKFSVKNMEINSNGTGDMSLKVTETISGTIKGVGDTNVYGSPRNSGLKSKGVGDLEFH